LFIQGEQTNPRFQSFASAFENLSNKLPRMSELLQELLSEQEWIVRRPGPNEKPLPDGWSLEPKRHRLRPGTSFEIELREPEMKWKGRVDAITLFNDSCSISDLKTGEPSESHIEQLRVYSVLWDGDRDLNPDRLPVSGLKIFYGSSVIYLDLPTKETLAEWRSAIVDRTERAEQELAVSPPPARPSPENCSGCQVKLLCDEYWKLRAQGLEEPFQDLELNLLSKRGDFGWVAQDTRNGAASRELLFTRPDGRVPYWDELTPGVRIRLTDAHYTDREGETPLVLPTTFSEVVLI
jgi:hypothetical protein